MAVVDGVTHAVLKYLLVGQRVWHGAFTPDEKYLLVANGVSNDVSVIDVAAPEGHQINPGRGIALGYRLRPALKIDDANDRPNRLPMSRQLPNVTARAPRLPRAAGELAQMSRFLLPGWSQVHFFVVQVGCLPIHSAI